jgi:hypothetical protein
MRLVRRQNALSTVLPPSEGDPRRTSPVSVGRNRKTACVNPAETLLHIWISIDELLERILKEIRDVFETLMTNPVLLQFRELFLTRTLPHRVRAATHRSS